MTGVQKQTNVPDVKGSEALGHVVHAIGRLDQSIEELAKLLRKGYIVESKKIKVEELLIQRKISRMYLRKTLLSLGGIDYMIPYWSM